MAVASKESWNEDEQGMPVLPLPSGWYSKPKVRMSNIV